MKVEEKIQALVGRLVTENLVLGSRVEELEKQVEELKKSAEKPK